MTYLDLLIASGWGDVNRKHVPPEVMAMAQRGETPITRKQWEARPRMSPEERAEVFRRSRLEKVPAERRREIGRMGGVAKWGDLYARRIREMLAQGIRSCEIARTLGCAPQSVYYQRKLLGMSRKNRRNGDVAARSL